MLRDITSSLHHKSPYAGIEATTSCLEDYLKEHHLSIQGSGFDLPFHDIIAAIEVGTNESNQSAGGGNALFPVSPKNHCQAPSDYLLPGKNNFLR